MNEHLLNGLGAGAHVQWQEAVLAQRVGVGTVGQQQLDTVGLAALTGLVEGGASPGRQVHAGPPQQQVPQAFAEAPPGRDVERGGQLLLVGQRPQPWGEGGVTGTTGHSPLAQEGGCHAGCPGYCVLGLLVKKNAWHACK